MNNKDSYRVHIALCYMKIINCITLSITYLYISPYQCLFQLTLNHGYALTNNATSQKKVGIKCSHMNYQWLAKCNLIQTLFFDSLHLVAVINPYPYHEQQ